MFTNSEEFRIDARYFQQHGRYDCGLAGTDEYEAFWDRHEDWLDNGRVIGDVAITGEMHGYLNFAQIRLTEDPSYKGNNAELVTRKRGTKVRTFPDFFDGDYTYFWCRKIARDGIEVDFYNKYVKPHMLCRIPEQYLEGGGRHLMVGKKRRAGYSYKNGWIAAMRYNRVPDALTLLCAYDKKYLYPKGTMQMASDYVDFINKHTVWSKRKLIDKQDHIKSGFMAMSDGIEYEEGFLSEIMAISFGNNPGAARGKDADLILVEECGAAPNLLDFEAATKPTVEDGLYVTGQMIYFGTGGGDNNYWEGFEKMFYDPDTYNILPVYNDWDEGARGTTCSFFVPETWNMKGAIDLNGNSLFDKAEEITEKRREDIKKSSKDGSALIKHMMERPLRPAEAFAISGSNIFPVADLQAHYNYTKINKLHEAMGSVGDLYYTSDGLVDFKINENNTAIWEFPHDNVKDLTGSVVIFNKPIRKEGVVPKNLYRLCNDPYAHDQSTNKESLGSTYVIMNPNNHYPPGDKIVACYHGRPKTQDDYNKIMFMLAEYYGCQIGFENDRGDVIGYAKRFKKLHLLAPEFELAFDANIPKSSVRRYYGMHIGSGKNNTRINQGNIYIRDWLIKPRGRSEDGIQLLNLHLIYDIGLLQELIKYKDGGNFDRVSSFRVGAYYEQEIQYKGKVVQLPQKLSKQSMFNRPLFQGT